MALGIAFVLLIVAVPLQVFGYATTCTQGADGSFIVGAIYSSLPLSVSIALVLFKALRAPQPRTAGILFIVVTLYMMALTRSIWADTLLIGTPCGPDFADYVDLSGPNQIGNAIIIGGYFVLPIIMLISAALLVLRGRRKSTG